MRGSGFVGGAVGALLVSGLVARCSTNEPGFFLCEEENVSEVVFSPEIAEEGDYLVELTVDGETARCEVSLAAEAVVKRQQCEPPWFNITSHSRREETKTEDAVTRRNYGVGITGVTWRAQSSAAQVRVEKETTLLGEGEVSLQRAT